MVSLRESSEPSGELGDVLLSLTLYLPPPFLGLSQATFPPPFLALTSASPGGAFTQAQTSITPIAAVDLLGKAVPK